MPTTIFEDNFAVASDTDLNLHTPDTTGTSWTLWFRSATEKIRIYNGTPDKVTVDSSTNSQGIAYYSTPDPTTADVSVEIVWGSKVSSSDDTACLILRGVDSSNYYACRLTTAGTVGIYKNTTAGGKVQIGTGSTSLTMAANDIWVFKVVGTSLTLTQNGTQRASATDSAFSSAGKCALGWGNICVATDDEVFADPYCKGPYKVIEYPATAASPLLAGPNLGKTLFRGSTL